MTEFKSLPESLIEFAMKIGYLRSNANEKQRDTYTVVLGQMIQCNLIEEKTYKKAMRL